MGFRIEAIIYLALFVTVFSVASSHQHPATSLFRNCNFDKIFQFGDSLSDTGNLVREDPTGISSRLPYGQSYFKEPTGRYSDGRLIIDFIAKAAGLPFLNPYEQKTADFTSGVNFAVAGSTALSVEDLAKKNILAPTTNSSLGVQLNWMADYLSSRCKPGLDCKETLKNSLFIMGETGGNDYNYALFARKSIEEVESIVPDVVQTIVQATRTIIKLGARRIVIPGNLPIGCLPSYLTMFGTENSTYDKMHCLKEYNDLAIYHNWHLKQAIGQLKRENPDIVIVYGNLYNAAKWLLAHAPSLGFDPNTVQKACCGSGGEYNFGFQSFCGAPGIQACQNPDQHISWDGVHLTQRAYFFLATRLINNMLPMLECPDRHISKIINFSNNL